MYSRQAPQELRRIHLAAIDWNSTERLDSRCLYLEAHHVFMASVISVQLEYCSWPQILMITTTYTLTLTRKIDISIYSIHPQKNIIMETVPIKLALFD